MFVRIFYQENSLGDTRFELNIESGEFVRVTAQLAESKTRSYSLTKSLEAKSNEFELSCILAVRVMLERRIWNRFWKLPYLEMRPRNRVVRFYFFVSPVQQICFFPTSTSQHFSMSHFSFPSFSSNVQPNLFRSGGFSVTCKHIKVLTV